jgi:tetratricopeptide (TPR) repeat protein
VSNLDQSLFYYKKAEKISRANNYVDELSNALNNIGAVYFDKKEYDTALEYYKESLDISSNYKYTTNYANTLLNIADIYKFQNNYTKSLEHYKKGLQIFKNTDSPYAIIEGYTSLSEFYYHFAEYDNALQSVERILAQAIEMDDSSYLMRIYKVYYQAYEQKGLYEKAYESLNLYRKYFNSFENHATMKTLKNISNQFEKDIIEREAKKATQEEAIKGKIAMTVTANHHLNQPLMVLQGNLDLLQYKLEKYKIYTCSENFNNLQRSINSFAKYLAEHNSHKER